MAPCQHLLLDAMARVVHMAVRDAACSRPTPAPQAATQGALLAGQRVAGIRIQVGCG